MCKKTSLQVFFEFMQFLEWSDWNFIEHLNHDIIPLLMVHECIIGVQVLVMPCYFECLLFLRKTNIFNMLIALFLKAVALHPSLLLLLVVLVLLQLLLPQ
jgi:hypothetical protein